MNKLLQSSKRFVKNNASTILTGVGSVGVIATAVMAVKATPKALSLIKEAEEKKGEELTKMEILAVAGPTYIPAILIGTTTIACIFGANILNKRQQAALMSAYALLDSTYKDYKAKVQELYGDDANDEIMNEIAKDKYEETDISPPADERLFYDEYSQRYFHSTTEKVLRAEYEINRILNSECGVYLNEFYELLGLERVDYGNFIGWSSFELMEMSWSSWLDFNHRKVVMDDGLEVTIIEMCMDPCFGFEDY